MQEVTFTVQCTMNERWVNDFCSMLKTMEANGNMGHSEEVGIYSDGDGDFRPSFDFSIDFEKTKPVIQDGTRTMYDAG